ncbi:GapR family DNA-binding domain-containing protein, partial [Paenochrobactrum glaciei]
SGFDVKAFKEIIKLRKKEDHERQEEEAMIQLYMDALGMT